MLRPSQRDHAKLLAPVLRRLRDGENVVVHCRSGMIRSAVPQHGRQHCRQHGRHTHHDDDNDDDGADRGDDYHDDDEGDGAAVVVVKAGGAALSQ